MTSNERPTVALNERRHKLYLQYCNFSLLWLVKIRLLKNVYIFTSAHTKKSLKNLTKIYLAATNVLTWTPQQTCGRDECAGRLRDLYPTDFTSSGDAYSLALLAGLKLDMTSPSTAPKTFCPSAELPLGFASTLVLFVMLAYSVVAAALVFTVPRDTSTFTYRQTDRHVFNMTIYHRSVHVQRFYICCVAYNYSMREYRAASWHA